MTTIAYRDGVLAADTRVTSCNNCAAGYVQKIGRLPDGALWGFTGALQVMEACVAWADERKGDPPAMDEGCFILISPDGLVRQWWGKGWIQSTSDAFAWGSGERPARAAMMAGAGVGRAVEIAAALDDDTGGDITVLSLGCAA